MEASAHTAMNKNPLTQAAKTSTAARLILPKFWRIWVVVLALVLMVGTGATLLITSAFADPTGPIDTGWEDNEFHPAIPVIKITTLIIDDEVFESKKLIFANGDQPKLLAVYTNPISNTDLQYSAVTYEYGKQQQGYVLIIEPVSATDTTKTRLAIPDYDKTEDGRAPWQKHGVNFNEISAC